MPDHDHAETPPVIMLLCHGSGKNLRLKNGKNPWELILITGCVHSVSPATSCKAESISLVHGSKHCSTILSLSNANFIEVVLLP